jgi:hypothetical protein
MIYFELGAIQWLSARALLARVELFSGAESLTMIMALNVPGMND